MIWIIKVVKIGLSSLLFGLLFWIASFLAMTFVPRNDSTTPQCLPLVGGGFVEGDEVEHGAHSGADTVAIGIFDFGGGEVGCDVGLHFFGHKEVVA